MDSSFRLYDNSTSIIMAHVEFRAPVRWDQRQRSIWYTSSGKVFANNTQSFGGLQPTSKSSIKLMCLLTFSTWPPRVTSTKIWPLWREGKIYARVQKRKIVNYFDDSHSEDATRHSGRSLWRLYTNLTTLTAFFPWFKHFLLLYLPQPLNMPSPSFVTGCTFPILISVSYFFLCYLRILSLRSNQRTHTQPKIRRMGEVNVDKNAHYTQPRKLIWSTAIVILASCDAQTHITCSKKVKRENINNGNGLETLLLAS